MTDYLVDANLLVLLIVGRYDRQHISRHRRLKQYTIDDYDHLVDMLKSPGRILVTPNTLTEASNLLRAQRGSIGTALTATLRKLIEDELEIVVPSKDAARQLEFTRLGLTDVALLEVASAERLLLTSDLQLYGAAVGQDPTSAVYFRATSES